MNSRVDLDERLAFARLDDSLRAELVALWPTVADLAAAPLDAVLVEWAGLGYYARARNLHACAVAVAERFGGRFPTSSVELLTLPGIGPYTAAAISAICADERIAVVDGNVDRVVARYLALPVPVRDAKDLVRGTVQQAVPARAGDFAQALMDLGATICAPRNASCMLCPLQPGCVGTRVDPLRFPVKAEKPDRPTRYGHAFVIFDSVGDVYLEKRENKGLLGGMTQMPVSAWGPERLPLRPPLVAEWRSHGQIVHVFTHFRLELEVWSARAADPAALDAGWWASPGELDAEALPSVFRKALAAAGVE